MILHEKEIDFARQVRVDTETMRAISELGSQINLKWKETESTVKRTTEWLSKQRDILREIKGIKDLKPPKSGNVDYAIPMPSSKTLEAISELSSGINVKWREQQETAKTTAEWLNKQREILKDLQNTRPLTIPEQVAADRKDAKERKEYQRQYAEENFNQSPWGKLFGAWQGGGLNNVLAGMRNPGSGFNLSSLFGMSGHGGMKSFLGSLNPHQLLSSARWGFMFGGVGGMMRSVMGNLAATGHPIGMLIAAIPAIAKGLGQLQAAPYQLIGHGLGVVSSGLKGLQGPLGPIGAMLNGLSGAAGTIASIYKKIPIVGDILGPQWEAMAAIPKVVGEIVNSLVDMTRLASPSTFKLWTYALEDTQAVIGHAFLPALELMRDGVRLVGDVLASILPNAQEGRDAIMEVRQAFAEIAEEMKNIANEVGPIIREFIVSEIRGLGIVMSGVANIVRGLTWQFRVLQDVLSALGLSVNDGGRSSIGAAARAPNIQSLSEYARELQLNAFREPPGIESRDPQERSASILQLILEWLEAHDPARFAQNIVEQGEGANLGVWAGHNAGRALAGILGLGG